MSEDTVTDGTPTGASPHPRLGLRRRPKHRGVGLKVVRGRVVRGGRPEASAGRRAVLALLGAALPLPLLVVGGLVLDGTLGAPARGGAPHAAASGHGAVAHGHGPAASGHGAVAHGHGPAASGHGAVAHGHG
ncbi:MAG: hypothetical protein VKQ33_02440, partial [Candidatus Sericytochromatia bacterium]|nr:hypothetical protein [Candidatus Sericytochromatia bacterium]